MACLMERCSPQQLLYWCLIDAIGINAFEQSIPHTSRNIGHFVVVSHSRCKATNFRRLRWIFSVTRLHRDHAIEALLLCIHEHNAHEYPHCICFLLTFRLISVVLCAIYWNKCVHVGVSARVQNLAFELRYFWYGRANHERWHTDGVANNRSQFLLERRSKCVGFECSRRGCLLDILLGNKAHKAWACLRWCSDSAPIKSAIIIPCSSLAISVGRPKYAKYWFGCFHLWESDAEWFGPCVCMMLCVLSSTNCRVFSCQHEAGGRFTLAGRVRNATYR